MERSYTIQDLLAALRRRRRPAALVGAAVVAVALIAIMALPNQYQAESVIQIEPHRLASEFWPAQSNGAFEDRMRSLKHGILARPGLERVVREVGLYPELGEDIDRRVEQLRKNVEVRLEGEVAGGPPALLFVVAVRGRDPIAVARAADLLPRIYGDSTRQLMLEQAKNLRQTLEAQAADMSRQLAGDEQKVVAFKGEHANELPETAEANMREASRIQAQIEMRQANIIDARRRRTSLLSTAPEAESEASRAQAGAEEAVRRLQAALAAYGPEHPDVKRARREYQEAKRRADAETKNFRVERIDPHLSRLDDEAREDQATIQQLQKQLADVQARVNAAPRWGETMQGMMRDSEARRAKYNAIVAKVADAQAAESLLATESGGLFRFVQPAMAPRRPIGPKRFSLFLVSLFAAAAAATGFAAAADFLDKSLRGPRDAAALELPVLAAIPRIGPRRSSIPSP